MPKPGVFNVYNALAATGVCLAAGVGFSGIASGVASWAGAPGRMEFIDEGQPFTVVVDFAHAPAALRRVLELLRSRSKGRTIAVFGSIGERERDRRAAMGRVAAECADFTIVTDDNPYSRTADPP
jgi:UDP-N-acetylmuramyl tripeptide synthase